MRLNPALLHDDDAITKQIRATIPGMAHWAGTGPENTYCGDCIFLIPRGALGYGCDKYRQLMGKQVENEIPRQTRSCRHFEKREVQYAKSNRKRNQGTRGRSRKALADT